MTSLTDVRIQRSHPKPPPPPGCGNVCVGFGPFLMILVGSSLRHSSILTPWRDFSLHPVMCYWSDSFDSVLWKKKKQKRYDPAVLLTLLVTSLCEMYSWSLTQHCLRTRSTAVANFTCVIHWTSFLHKKRFCVCPPHGLCGTDICMDMEKAEDLIFQNRFLVILSLLIYLNWT